MDSTIKRGTERAERSEGGQDMSMNINTTIHTSMNSTMQMGAERAERSEANEAASTSTRQVRFARGASHKLAQWASRAKRGERGGFDFHTTNAFCKGHITENSAMPRRKFFQDTVVLAKLPRSPHYV